MVKGGSARRWSRVAHGVRGRLVIALAVGGSFGLAYEFRTSALQAEVFAYLGRELSFELAPGPNPELQFPRGGPYDRRLGYDRLGATVARLTADSHVVTAQARQSSALARLVARNGFALYDEKTRAGLRVLDRHGEPLFTARYPERTYESFAEVPEVLVRTLLFIEDRDLLSPVPMHNPAVDWSRLPTVAEALLHKTMDSRVNVPGGSTLATQIEKYRHSPGGQTADARGKLHQMLAASQRAYLDGADTAAARRRIVVDYLNSTPLSARPRIGEVNGLGDGLRAWYGVDFDDANRILRRIATPGRSPHDHDLPVTRVATAGALVGLGGTTALQEQARVYKLALSLLLAQRRPSDYLLGARDSLRRLTDSHLRVLAAAGIIDPELRDAALPLPLEIVQVPAGEPEPDARSKIAQTLRADLLGLLGERSLYDLDHLDLTVRSTVDGAVQREVAEVLQRLADPAFAAAQGLVGPRLLSRGDPAGLAYSVTIFERGADANYVRVRADNLDRPLDLNTGAKLDLGSTAKLRTLATYLLVVSTLHERYGHLDPARLAEVRPAQPDTLTAWALDYLAGTADRGLSAMLEAAMARRYSANPGESFFTGGGLHTFANFDSVDDPRVVTVAEALRKSINLPFIRLMRDVVAFYMREADSGAGDVLRDHKHPDRTDYLAKFADREGSIFLRRFYERYRGLVPAGILRTAAERARQRPNALAVVFRSINPEGSLEDFSRFLATQPTAEAIGEAAVARLYRDFAPDKWPLSDRGYIARLHPLELWLARYLYLHPTGGIADVLAASQAERLEAYEWLIDSKRWRAQNLRIRIVLEEQAFELIHATWRRMGYPFSSLVPSLATALGSSADRPAALAELMGIILNDGVRLPVVRVEELEFAAETPYETRLAASPREAQRVLPPEVAQILKRALLDVVDTGTGRRAAGAVIGPDGLALPIGGKTGTGDHRFKRFAGGRLVSSTVVNRNACFVFFIGERHFGTIVAHVKGADAANYSFTSALPTQILKILGPSLAPLLERRERLAGGIPEAAQASLE